MTAHVDVLDLVSRLKAADEPFALATVVRTVSVTAAKAGAKAIIRPDGRDRGRLDRRRLRARRNVEGRARGAGRRPVAADLHPAGGPAGRARRQAGRGPRRREVRKEHVPEPGHHGHLRRADAAAARRLSCWVQARWRWRSSNRRGCSAIHVTLAAPLGDLRSIPEVDRARRRLRRRAPLKRTTLCRRVHPGQRRRSGAEGSARASRPLSRLRRQPPQDGVAARQAAGRKASPPAALDQVKAPAGLDLGAITPEEIALSIIAEVIVARRAGQREAPPKPEAAKA